MGHHERTSNRRRRPWVITRVYNLTTPNLFYIGKVTNWWSETLLEIQLYDFARDNSSLDTFNESKWIKIQKQRRTITANIHEIKEIPTRIQNSAVEVLKDWFYLLNLENERESSRCLEEQQQQEDTIIIDAPIDEPTTQTLMPQLSASQKVISGSVGG